MPRHSADYRVKQLGLTQHIEGGWYREIYRSGLRFDKQTLPGRFNGDRSACTHIYFLLAKEGFSAFHRIQSDELWHFYEGDPLVIYEINQEGQMVEHLLGQNQENNESLFCWISAGNWFASRLVAGGEYALTGCTVAPGFDFGDFELADRDLLTQAFPRYHDIIRQLTR